LLTKARTTLMPELASAGGPAAKELGCIRPYTPDVMNFLQNWGGFYMDGLNKPNVQLLHTLVSVLPFPNTIGQNTVQWQSAFPQLHISIPHAPGEAWNQPWYQPQCGITPSVMDPAHDPEANTYDRNGSKSTMFPSH
jgi:hypothetical protein